MTAATRVQTDDIRIRTSGAKMGSASSVTPIAADILSQSGKSVFYTRLTNLFHAVLVRAHPVHVLRDDRVVVTGELEPIEVDRASITGISADRQADLGPGRTSV